MTLNGQNASVAEIKSSYGAHQKNLNEDRHKLSAAKCSSMSLLSCNITLREYSQGLPRQEAPNDSTPIISGLGKATNFKFGRYIQSVYANKSRLKIWEKLERGCIQGLPNFFEYPLLSQKRIKVRTSNVGRTFLVSIGRKVHYKFLEK